MDLWFRRQARRFSPLRENLAMVALAFVFRSKAMREAFRRVVVGQTATALA